MHSKYIQFETELSLLFSEVNPVKQSKIIYRYVPKNLQHNELTTSYLIQKIVLLVPKPLSPTTTPAFYVVVNSEIAVLAPEVTKA
jgi:hypothetical protein